ncbi:retrotransposon protein, putative, ty1-copia subclass [Tanacetum coccineum]|uniref:Retrotransposon protein, putative, ty1-copia subclass n=1 Tax=Tanacetum coccineum TaxID=301880 RepID=A0ABQ4ZXZ2_9ASTR
MFQAKARKERIVVVKSLMACKPKPGASICAFVLEMKCSSCVDCWSQCKLLIPTGKERPQKESLIMGLRERINLRLNLQAIQRKQCDSTATQRGHWKRTFPKYLKDLKDGKVKKGSHSAWRAQLSHGKQENNACDKDWKVRAHAEDGYKFSFDNENGDILVYSNGCFMFKASPCKGIYENVECISHNGNLTPPRTPPLNRVVEMRNRTLLDMVRSMMSQATLSISFWGYALETVVHILDLVPTKKVSKTPFKMWNGKRPSLWHIKIWGCEVYVRREAQDKLEARTKKSRRGVFLEREMISKEDSRSKIELEKIQESAYEEPIVNTDTQQEVVTPVKPDGISLPMRKTSGRVSKPTQLHYGFHIEEDKISDSTLSKLDEPTNYKEAMASPEAAK